MKSKKRQEPHRFRLSLLYYGNAYYVDRIAELEEALAKKPRQVQLDMMGQGEIHPDWALLIRSILIQRNPKTQLITNARTSLKNGSVLVWLLGDRRIIRDDAKLFFRRTDALEDDDTDVCRNWKADTDPETNPDKTSYVKMMDYVNEFLPVQELAGRVIDVSELRQFGLIENEKLDLFLKSAFGRNRASDPDSTNVSKEKRSRSRSKVDASGSAQK